MSGVEVWGVGNQRFQEENSVNLLKNLEDFRLLPALNALCEGVFSMEAALVSRFSLPYGLGVIACGERRTA